jgi:hypothetical protein
VAGENGATLSANDPIVSKLWSSLKSLGNPYVPLQIVSYQPVLFQVAARIDIDQTNYDTGQVIAQVWENLVSAFAFPQRLLGQQVAASEIVSIVQGTPGVVALQLQGMFLSGSPSTTVPSLLCASGPMPPQGAQMLLLDPASQRNLGVWS